MSVNYIKLGGYEYEDNPNEQTICFGQAHDSVFIHQIIENTDMPMIDLEEAVKTTNEATLEYADDKGFDIAISEPVEIMVDLNPYMICEQDMSFDDGRHAVQQNIYFFDPDDHVLRMVQFGTVPLAAELWDIQGEALQAYTSQAIRQILNNMATPPDAPHVPVKRFVPRSLG